MKHKLLFNYGALYVAMYSRQQLTVSQAFKIMALGYKYQLIHNPHKSEARNKRGREINIGTSFEYCTANASKSPG